MDVPASSNHGLFLFLTIISNHFFSSCRRKKRQKSNLAMNSLKNRIYLKGPPGKIQPETNTILASLVILTLHDWKPLLTVAFTGQWKYLKEIILSATRNKKLGRQRDSHPFCADFTLSDSFWLSPSSSSSLTGQVASPSPLWGVEGCVSVSWRANWF